MNSNINNLTREAQGGYRKQRSHIASSKTPHTNNAVWKTVGVRVKQQDLFTLNQRLQIYGFETVGQLISDFTIGKFPVITEDRQIQRLDANNNIQSSNQSTIINSSFEPTFYKNVDLEDMLKYYLNIRKFGLIADRIWNNITRQFEFINGAQISNSFIVLMALSESEESLSTTQISEIISSKSYGKLFKVSGALKES